MPIMPIVSLTKKLGIVTLLGLGMGVKVGESKVGIINHLIKMPYFSTF